MISRLVFLLFCGHFAQILGNAGKLPRVKKQSLKVQINVTNDAVCMRYIHPTPSTKLEGFILGYGSSFFSNQYIPLPSNGKMYITEVDAEPRYLIVVRPAPVPNNKKSCSGKTKKPKPLQLVIGTLTPTSVFLSWGILVNPKHDWTTMNNCPNDRFYTVRYREKDKSKKWILQLCPSTETVVDNLKPNTIYEFGVKDNIDDGIWSKSFIHKVVIPGKNKENGQLQNNYKFPKIHTQFIPDSKTLVPVKVIKQVLQNITHRTQSEILQRPPLSGPILVHLIIPDFNATKQKPPSSSRFDIFEKPKQILAKNKTQEWLPESKISEVKEITPKSQIDLEKSKSTAAGVSKDSTVSQAHTESELESSTPSKAPMTEMPPVTLDLLDLGIPKARTSPTPHMPTESSVLKKMQPVPSESETPVLKTIQTKAAVTDEPTLESFPYKTSKTLAWPRATLVSTLPSLKQNIPKISRITEKLKASPAEKESQEKTTASSIFKTPELPRTTMAVTNKLIPLPDATKISVTDGHPVATMASKEINPVPSKSKEFDYTKPEEPDRKLASYKPSPVPPRFKEPVYIMPEVPDRKHVSTEDDHYLPKVLTTPELPITKSVSYESSPVPSKFKESGYILPEVPDKKPASYKPSPVPPKFKEPESIMPEVPDRKHVSTEEENYLPKVLTTTERPITKPDAKTKHHISITKTTINPLLLPKSDVEEVIFKTEQAKSSTAPKETHQVPTRPKTSSSPDITPTKSSLNVKHHDPSKPKSPPGQKTQQSKPDPKETRLLPSKPKPSDKQEKNKTKPGSSKLNNKVTVTKTPHLKKVVHRTTPATPRTRTPGGPSWSKKPRGEKLTNEDVAKPLHPSSSTKSSIPIDSTVVRKKPDPVATLPGSPRPPLAPARPTPIRRKPLPPNNVTGKPGRSGNILMPRASSILTTSIAKPTWPSSLVKTNSPKKLPTAAASPDYNNPMFSSIPTSDTDIAGTPRYTGDHVKYLKKKDDEPCSITDTIQHFPSDIEDNSDMATSAPQKPPTNLTVVTVEGCPSFVVLDWKKPENETVTEYKVVSTENGGTVGKDKSIITTNQTHSTVENLKPNTSYEFVVIPSNPLGEGPSSESKPFRTESADPRVTESISMGKDAIWTEVSFNSDDYSECKGKQYVKRTWYKKFVGVQLCNSLRYKIYLSDTLTGTFYNIGDQRGHGEDHCQFVDSYFDGKTGQMLPSDQLPTKDGYFRAVRQEPVHFGKIGAGTHNTYVNWYECGTTIPGKW